MMKHLKIFLPFLASLIAIILEIALPDSPGQPKSNADYYFYFSIALSLVTLLNGVSAYIKKEWQEGIIHKSLFRAAVILFIAAINLITNKFLVLPVIYFPSPSRVIGAIFEDKVVIGKCLLYSSRLLITGFITGAIAGMISGIAVGFSKKAAYWLNPIVRFIGPIPSTAWIPLVLVAFPGTVSASCFLIALSVWFPTLLMTSSGIQNLDKDIFEVSETLGANWYYKIFKVGVPAAMPSIFIGLFTGICSSFITLMTAEMIGAKYGLGWYVNWQKEMMCYSNVYAGLIVIAIAFSIVITILFKFKDRILVWQKGVIKW